MSEELWVVRAGEQAKYVREFEANSYIAIGFHQLASDDLSLTDEETVKGRVTSPAERTYAGQLVACAYRMQVGDLVIVPRLPRKHRDYLVARISGPYRHIALPPASGHHQRQVQWLGTFSRGSLSPSAINTLGAILTLFRPAAVDAGLRGLLTTLTPIGPGLASDQRTSAEFRRAPCEGGSAGTPVDPGATRHRAGYQGPGTHHLRPPRTRDGADASARRP